VRSILLLGFLMGMRHALEADHLAAVASLATRSRSTGAVVMQGAAWGLGHTLTLLVVGGACLLLGAVIPERASHALELAVGLVLLLLGAQVLRRLRRQRVHVHVHRHDEGAVHIHAHSHAPEGRHDPAHHEHAHPAAFPRRALAVGLVHGLAGSAALLLLTVAAVGSPWVGLAYIALFGVGSILGMAALSAVIAVPLRMSAGLLSGMYNGLELFIGCATLVIGARVLYQAGSLLGLSP
jgi:ABC-type nickel/cobalt efflux system permease component RcnA